MSIVDLWKKFQHSNVVQLREVFTTKSFGDQCNNHTTYFFSYFIETRTLSIIVLFILFRKTALVLVYNFHPGSQTLLAKYFTPTTESNNYQDPFQGEARPFR